MKFQIKNNNYVTLTDFLNQHVFDNLVNAGLFAPLSIILRYFMKALLSLKTTVVPIKLTRTEEILQLRYFNSLQMGRKYTS